MERIELHLHTMYSFLDGVGTPEEYVKRAKKLGMKAVGITDHGTACGLFHFHEACKEGGIKPILGVEFYTCEKFSLPDKKKKKKIQRHHIVALAKNHVGYLNLLKLASLGFKTFNYRPLINVQDLFDNKEGLIVTTACIASSITNEELFVKFKEEFGDDFYAEIQPLDLSTQWNKEYKNFEKTDKNSQIDHNKQIVGWARKHNVKLIHTLDVHYPDEHDKKIQDIFILNSFAGRDGWHFATDNHYLMNTAQAWNEFKKHGHDKIITKEEFDLSVQNSNEIADKVEIYDLGRKPEVVKFAIDNHPLATKGMSSEDLLLAIVKKNNKIPIRDDYIERLNFELTVIREKGFVDYFLIIEDIVRWCRANDILVGPGRGSVGGSLLSYALDITKLDPVKYDMPFERFLDISRTDYPDIDLDFSDQEAVFNYLREKYGQDRVIRVGILQGIKTKTAIKDAYRVLRKEEYDYAYINTITKDIPSSSPGADEREWFENFLFEEENKELQEFFIANQDVFKATLKMVGKIKTNKVHPCAIVIAPENPTNYIPVVINKPNASDATAMTGYDGRYLEKAGLVKFDILSLNTLRDIQGCLKLLKLRRNIDLDIYSLEPTDKKVLDRFKKGDTESVFQFNTALSTPLLERSRADTFNDLAIITAIGRPGPYRLGKMDEKYVDRKLGKKLITYSHPALEPILKDTYGLMVYQEQIMKIFQSLGGFTAVESNHIRKAISKPGGLKEEAKNQFICYATTKLSPPMTEEEAYKLLGEMANYASYCFNRSHSVCYSYIGYVCQYLKTYYPLEWWASVFQNCSTDDFKGFIEDDRNNFLREILIEPEINESEKEFKLNKNDKLVMPLTYVTQVADRAIQEIVSKRPFDSFKDFWTRVEKRIIKKNVIENLILANTFRDIEPDKSIRDLIMHFYFLRKENVSKKFDNIDNTFAFEELKKNALTIYRTDWVKRFDKLFTKGTIGDYTKIPPIDNQTVRVGGLIDSVQKAKTKTGKDFYRVKVKNGDSAITVYVWSDIIPVVKNILIPNIMVEIVGSTSKFGLALNSMKRIAV